MWHLKMLILWILVNCAPAWYAIYSNARLAYNEKRDEERFKPFVRNDYNSWSYVLCIWTHFFFIPRWLGCIAFLMYALLGTKIICIGVKIDEIGPTRTKLIVMNANLAMYFFGACFGVYQFKHIKPEVDYRKWLGPDWKPHYDNFTMYVSNHNGWNEIFNIFLFARPMPGFIAKETVKEIPAIGHIATAIGSVFMQRNSKDSRKQIFELILKK